MVHHPKSITSPRPNDGNQFNSTEKIQINKTPIRKVGRETPMSEDDNIKLEINPVAWRRTDDTDAVGQITFVYVRVS